MVQIPSCSQIKIKRSRKRMQVVSNENSPPLTPDPSSSTSWSPTLNQDPFDDDTYLSLTNAEVTQICHFVLQELVPTPVGKRPTPTSGRSRSRSSPHPSEKCSSKDDAESSTKTSVDVPLLEAFIHNALHRTRLPAAIPLSGLVLLRRFSELYPSASGVATSAHRMFLASYMIASKLLQDNSYSNKSWVIVSGGLFTLAEVGMMEKELASFLGWDLRVTRSELDDFVVPIMQKLGLASLSMPLCPPPAPFSQCTQPITPGATPDMIPSSTGRWPLSASSSTTSSCSWREPLQQQSGWYDDDDDAEDAGPVTPAEKYGKRDTSTRQKSGSHDEHEWSEEGLVADHWGPVSLTPLEV